MSQFKRIRSAIVAQVDRFVTQVENHDALVDVALLEMRQGLARAQVQLGRVEADGRRLMGELERSRQDATRWRERARASTDDAQALECVRRMKRAEQTTTELEGRVARHEDAARQLRRDVERLRERLQELVGQRNLMRTREARAQAAAIAGDGGRATVEVCELFERWETRVAEAELLGGVGGEPVDRFAEAFAQAEEEADLGAELEALREQS